MDWQRSTAGAGQLLLSCCLLMSFTLTHTWSLAAIATPAAAPAPATTSSRAWSPVVAAKPIARQLNQISPYLDLALCPIRDEPWTCARQRSAKILDVWDAELSVQWQKLKVEADRQLNATLERRGYSASELPISEKPSTLLKKIEIGTKYMKEYLAETMDGFLGREYEYLQAPKAASSDSENADYDDETDNEADADAEGEGDAADSADTGEEEDEADGSDGEQETSDAEEDETEDEPDNESVPIVKKPAANVEVANANGNANEEVKNSVLSADGDGTSGGVEFIELEDGAEDAAGAVKKPGGGKRKKMKNKKKNKKKGQQQQPATLVVVQAAPEHHDVDFGHESDSPIVSHGHGGDEGGAKPFKRKQKRGKRKKKGQQGSTVLVQDHESSDPLGLELLEELVDSGVGIGGGKRKHKFSTNYGRSNGVTRGKKKKKRKALAKLALIGTLLKAKIELLLKILGAHLQIKFFAIALIGLLINIARFWIDVKRGGTPSKVVYVEHAHHQHHYEDHGDDWGGEGSYWKRSLQTDPSIEDVDSSTDSYQLRTQPQQQQAQDAHYLAYRNQYQWQ
ncbi:uncharacterized protein LOC133843739 isoform X1 [Drosophila sulfurigaster albostrigata]|uniref:uncharacterized protein LOC133843739 isoform X1 n=1 Tax=Drosophila sulfurigaster albostrigata TaxID=89887 RepID=UPI002D21D161|nr:uncharacterized protein LOC133843739 isoform X1 [Drosophila sulfurigaster albostrigata]